MLLRAPCLASHQVDEQAFVNGFQPMLMDVAAAWCRGNKLNEILKMTHLFEVGHDFMSHMCHNLSALRATLPPIAWSLFLCCVTGQHRAHHQEAA